MRSAAAVKLAGQVLAPIGRGCHRMSPAPVLAAPVPAPFQAESGPKACGGLPWDDDSQALFGPSTLRNQGVVAFARVHVTQQCRPGAIRPGVEWSTRWSHPIHEQALLLHLWGLPHPHIPVPPSEWTRAQSPALAWVSLLVPSPFWGASRSRNIFLLPALRLPPKASTCPLRPHRREPSLPTLSLLRLPLLTTKNPSHTGFLAEKTTCPRALALTVPFA